jgi:hypothetical protein
VNKLGPINLPQDYRTDYDKRLSVMLYEYLRRVTYAINALLEATGVDFPIGSETPSAEAVAVTEALDQPQTLRDRMQDDVLTAILVELRVMNLQLQAGLNLQDNPAELRGDESLLN